MITEKDIKKAKKGLQKLGFAPIVNLAKGAGNMALGGAKAFGKAFGGAADLTLAARKSPGAGMIDTALTGAGLLGAGAMVASPFTFGLSEKALGAVPVAGTASKFLNPYSGLRVGERAGDRYKALGEMYQRRGASNNNAFYNMENQNLSRYLTNKRNFQKAAEAKMFSSDEIKRYYKLKGKIEKTASVAKLRKSVQGAKSGGGDFARQALAYMAGATALGVGAPLVANMVGEGTSFARRGRLNRDYNEMIKQDPELRRDPQARQYFELLHRSSPYVAQEPVIAATVVRNLVDSPALDGKKFKDILDIERARQDTKHPMMKDPTNMSKMMKLQGFGD